MDSLTQLTLGAAVGEAALGHKVGKRAPLWGAFFGTLPDLDVLANPFLSEIDALAFHRSLTHSLLFMVLMSPLMGWALHRLHATDSVNTRRWGWMIFAVLATHVGLDCLTTYGTQIFYPFSRYPVILGTIFIIDPLYTVPLGAGLLIGLMYAPTHRRRRMANYIGLGLSTAYLVLTGINKLYIEHTFETALKRQSLPHERVYTKPTALNNVLWSGIVEDSTAFWVGYYSLFDDDTHIRFERIPKNHELLGAAASSPAMDRLRWFSRGYFTVSRHNGALYVHDLRFGRSDLGMSDSGRYLFTFRLIPNETGEYTGFSQARPEFNLRGPLLRRFWARLLGHPHPAEPFRKS